MDRNIPGMWVFALNYMTSGRLCPSYGFDSRNDAHFIRSDPHGALVMLYIDNSRTPVASVLVLVWWQLSAKWSHQTFWTNWPHQKQTSVDFESDRNTPDTVFCKLPITLVSPQSVSLYWDLLFLEYICRVKPWWYLTVLHFTMISKLIFSEQEQDFLPAIADCINYILLATGNMPI